MEVNDEINCPVLLIVIAMAVEVMPTAKHQPRGSVGQYHDARVACRPRAAPKAAGGMKRRAKDSLNWRFADRVGAVPSELLILGAGCPGSVSRGAFEPQASSARVSGQSSAFPQRLIPSRSAVVAQSAAAAPSSKPLIPRRRSWSRVSEGASRTFK